MKSIAVYCGLSEKVSEKYLETASRMGRVLAERGIRVVYGAGNSGMMGAVANGALEVGGEVIGVIPEIFNTPELFLSTISRMEVMPDMHSRLARMMDLSEGFIALPGGFGTMDEFFQTVTWAQIGLHNKPIGLLNHAGYYDHLASFMRHMQAEGFVHSKSEPLYLVEDTPEAMLDAIISYIPSQEG